MECKYCKLKFSGGAPRIREHFIRRNPSVGVGACKGDPAEIEDVVAAMAEIDDAQKEKEQHATKKRQLDRNTASMSAASEAAASTQLTMDTCKKAVTKAYVDAAVARFIYGTGTPFWVVDNELFRDVLTQVRLHKYSGVDCVCTYCCLLACSHACMLESLCKRQKQHIFPPAGG